MLDLQLLTGHVVIRGKGESRKVADETKSQIGLATPDRDGLMSKEDKRKLDQSVGFEFGNEEGTVCEGNDPRLSDARPANGGKADQVGELTPDLIETKKGSLKKASQALKEAKEYAESLTRTFEWSTWETPVAVQGNWPGYGTVYAEWADWNTGNQQENQ